MRRLRPLLASFGVAAAALVGAVPGALAQSGTLNISATVLSKNQCKFGGGGAAMTLGFGDIDPSTAGPKTATVARTFTCVGKDDPASFTVTADGGQYHSGTTRRMRHGTLATEFLAYALALSPASGVLAKNATGTVTITGTIDQSAYQNANVGAYSDTVTITLSP